jgi:hypothetical protein
MPPSWTIRSLLVIIGLHLGSAPGRADEGFWLFNDPPRKLLKEHYNFDVSDAWLERLRQSSVWFSSGGSGSIISPDGLVMTNRHIGADTLQELSSEQNDLLTRGFLAKSRTDEIKCPDLTLTALVSVEDVTARVNAAIKPDMPPAKAAKARRAILNLIEQESREKTGLLSDVTKLYWGGLYLLQRFKTYTDVRLVFAPEGGAKNWFDVCFFRLYENEKPSQTKHFLQAGSSCPKPGELVFIAGYPGETRRQVPLIQLESRRDYYDPLEAAAMQRRRATLENYRPGSPECIRRSQHDFDGLQAAESRNAKVQKLLQPDSAIIGNKKAEEIQTWRLLEKNPRAKADFGKARERIAALQDELRACYRLYFDLAMFGRGSELYRYAATLLELVQECEKPNAERYDDYTDQKLEAVKRSLEAIVPIYPDYEIVMLQESLEALAGCETQQDLAKKILAGRTAKQCAEDLVIGSSLRDVEVRRRILKGGRQALEKNEDPLIGLARLLDGPTHKARSIYEKKVDEPMIQAFASLYEAIRQVRGTEFYPDANATLRLSFGTVKGERLPGRQGPALRTIGTLVHVFYNAEYNGTADFELPADAGERLDRLRSDLPMHFKSDADGTFGNSGSPLVNRRGELVGLIFAMNSDAIQREFLYDGEKARLEALYVPAIAEILRKLYNAEKLAAEIMGAKE